MYYCFPTIFCVLACLIPTGAISAQDLDSPRPIAGIDTVFIEEMTWMDVRDAIRDGKTTAIVATGGVEQNGPYVASGKHNFVLQASFQWEEKHSVVFLIEIYGHGKEKKSLLRQHQNPCCAP